MAIIIIGAGTSGLTAGLTLLFHGIMDFIILESSDRIGGRLNTKGFEHGVNDLGVQLIYNEDSKNEFMDILKEKDLITGKTDLFWQSSMTLSNGDKIPDETVRKFKTIIDSVSTADTNDLDGIFGDRLRKKFSDGISNNEIDEDFASEFLQLYEKFICVFNGFETTSDITNQGSKMKVEPLYALKNVGFDSILEALEQHFNVTAIQDKVLLNKKVTKIIYDKQNQNESVEVICEDGANFVGENVITTLPLGVLKEIHSKTFVPPLPESKVNAIQSFGVGTTNKIFLEFNVAWWDSEWAGATFVWRQSELFRIKNTKYFWIKGIVGFYPVQGQANVLQAIIHGKNSVMMELAKETDLQKGIKYMLEHFLKVEQKPSRIMISKWATDPNYRGSHSYDTVSAQLFRVTRGDLASPLLNLKGLPVIFFSGEATSPENYGTVIGAMEAGKREALRVVDVLSGRTSFTREVRETKPKLEKSVDVLILGAGAAGIGSARKLDGTNLKYLVLEGSESVGGRIHSKYMTNTNPNLKEKVLVSAGAQWLHGRRNPLYTYAKNMGLVVFDKSQEESGIFIRDDGVEIEEAFVEEIETIVEDIIEEADEIYYAEIGSSYPESLEKFLNERFEQKIRFHQTEKKIQARQLLDWHKRSISIDNAAGDFKKISAKHWGRFEYIGGRWEHISLKNGFAEVLELMAKDLGSDKFVFNKVVEKVHWASEMTFDGPDNVEKKNILVKCTDGSLYSANHVITTFSLGVLKHDADNLFVPALPYKHKAAINCLGFGPITKVFLQFESNWWGDDEGVQFVYRENDYDEEEENFLRYMSGFELVYTGPPNTMIGWVGNKGVELMEKLSDKEIIDAIMKHLEKFVGYSLSYPKRYFVSRWLNNPLTRGAYSYASVDCDKDNITPNDLAAKITYGNQYANFSTPKSTNKDGSPLLQFAGEGSSQYYYSTAHGAYLSGEDAAKSITKYNNRDRGLFKQLFDNIKFNDLLQLLGFLPTTFINDIFESFQ